MIPWGIAGASIGDAVSYWIGRYFKDRVPGMWPFRGNPEQLERGYRFFERWGVLSVFIGRFFGPLRASVPLAALAIAVPIAVVGFLFTLSAFQRRRLLWLGLLASAAVGTVLALGVVPVEWHTTAKCPSNHSHRSVDVTLPPGPIGLGLISPSVVHVPRK